LPFLTRPVDVNCLFSSSERHFQTCLGVFEPTPVLFRNTPCRARHGSGEWVAAGMGTFPGNEFRPSTTTSTRYHICRLMGLMRKHHSRFIWSIIAAMIVGLSVHTSYAYAQKPKKRGVQDVTPPASSNPTSGANYALVIGNNNYQYVTKLKTAVNDANAVAQLLREQYGFTTTVLLDATRNKILTALNNYRHTLPPDSNLLIYYAGHGYHDRDTDKAYWLPVEAQKDNNENWISADDISSDVKAIPSSHVLIISDSCYSGVLTRDAEVDFKPQNRALYLAKLEKSKSRTLMASGGDEPVADGGAPGHSIFASAVLDSFHRMEQDKFTAADLFHRFLQP